jgi:DNA replicative helicase MCM subunit Mcm2 (Cdc46/Mcm family)
MQDRRLASHVLSVHKEGHAPAPADGPPPLTPELLRAYIAAAKQHDPHFPRDLTGALQQRVTRRTHAFVDACA